MSAKRKFGPAYQSALLALKRSGVISPGIVSGLLLECFVCRNGELKAAEVEAKGLCQPGKFTPWREHLIVSGWLRYTFGQYSKHEPGPKLIIHLNKAKMYAFEMATQASLNALQDRTESRFEEQEKLIATKEEYEALSQKVELAQDELKATNAFLAIMIGLLDPPYEDKKKLKLLKGGYNQEIKDRLGTVPGLRAQYFGEDEGEDLAEAVGPH
jgi:hypothetical protein